MGVCDDPEQELDGQQAWRKDGERGSKRVTGCLRRAGPSGRVSTSLGISSRPSLVPPEAQCWARARSVSVRLLVLALLAVLGEDRRPASAKGGLWPAVTGALRGLCDLYDKSFWEPMHAVDRYFDPDAGNPLAGVVAPLAEFGALTGDARKPVITTLGRWAAGHLPVGLPALADPGLPAGEMIAAAAQFSDAEQQDHVAWGWLAERDAAAAAREILTAAEELPPLLRGVAVRGRTAGGGRAAGLARAGGGTARRPARPRRAGGLGPGPRARRRKLAVAGGGGRRGSAGGQGPR